MPADPITQRLNALVEQSPDLKAAAELYGAILPLLRAADLRVAPVTLTPEHARARLESGLPLLHAIDLGVDDQAVCDLMIQLARALEEAHSTGQPPKTRLPFRRKPTPEATALAESARAGNRAAAAHQIRLGLEQGKIEMSALLPRVAAGDSAFVQSFAQSVQIDSALFWTIAQNALKPALRVWSRQLAPLARGIEWDKGYCLICGAGATLGELQGNDQEKHLRCGPCGADWRFWRLQCAFCGNADPGSLSQLYSEPQRATMRVEVCDRCHGYLKVISAFSPTPVDLLAVEDLATLHLDYIAQGRGYARVPLQ